MRHLNILRLHDYPRATDTVNVRSQQANITFVRMSINFDAKALGEYADRIKIWLKKDNNNKEWDNLWKMGQQTEKEFSRTSEVMLTGESDTQQHLSLCMVMHISCQKTAARKYCLHLKTINEMSNVSAVKIFLSLLHDLEDSYNLNNLDYYCIISPVSVFVFVFFFAFLPKYTSYMSHKNILRNIFCDFYIFAETWFLILLVQSDPGNSNSVISNSLVFKTQNHIPWICSSVIILLSAISNSCYFELFFVSPESPK